MGENKFLYRYLTIPKFLNMMRESSIIFTRLDIFEDKLEGISELTYFTKKAINNYEGSKCKSEEEFIEILLKQISRSTSADRVISQMKANGIKEVEKLQKDKEKFIDYIKKISKNDLEEFKSSLKSYYISCWSSGNESLAMWDLYVGRNIPGVLLKVDKEILYKELNSKSKKLEKGYVKYSNYNNFYDLEKEIFIKRKYFEYENEYRFITIDENNPPKVKKIKIDLKSIIDKIYISPRINKWEQKEIEKMIFLYNKKYSFLNLFEKQVKKSNLFL